MYKVLTLVIGWSLYIGASHLWRIVLGPRVSSGMTGSERNVDLRSVRSVKFVRPSVVKLSMLTLW